MASTDNPSTVCDFAQARETANWKLNPKYSKYFSPADRNLAESFLMLLQEREEGFYKSLDPSDLVRLAIELSPYADSQQVFIHDEPGLFKTNITVGDIRPPNVTLEEPSPTQF